MNPLVRFVQAHRPQLSQEDLALIADSFYLVKKQKGEHLLTQDKTCQYLYFLIEGITRSYSIRNGHDITTWFGFKDEFITSFTSFFPGHPSYESIEMLSDGQLYQISRQEFTQLQNDHPLVESIVHHFTLAYTLQLERRLFQIQTHSAAEKYQAILEQEPRLIQQIPNKHLASYLGITRETLSRIRSKR